MVEALWLYITVFVMAATPWLEILFVIPIGIGLGLHPIGVAIVSLIGNLLPLFLIVYFINKILNSRMYQRWMTKRKQKKAAKRTVQSSVDGGEAVVQNQSTARGDKAKAIFEKYGLPGLAISGPAITGIHLAAIIALSLKANRSAVIFWMTGSLTLWTVILTYASYHGIDWMTDWLQ
ncbi:small multi-drug export protein [Texcoconibacillus texcoconensis]|uniref:Putative membrane protein n=1 Tax=Texcoconibacillus texcoconensis TaxID=1095777 RepID=A0A840QT37_9BACI|nr:small multi-drug export protein [Texcoconibacillus texcoconensis]MBB5174692.1 putative membrane protein [Texcoconibacillus texcoconensis]